MRQIIEKMMEAAKACAEDPYGNREPEWFIGAMSNTAPVFQTRFSEDHSRSSNGGAYHEYVRFIQTGTGVRMEGKSSYEDSDYEEEGFWPSALDNAALCRLANLACLKIKVEMAPPPIDDIKTVRRRVEDALRKTATANDLLAVASLLNVKTE